MKVLGASFLLAVLLGAPGAGWAMSSPPPQAPPSWVEGQVLVKFRPGVSEAQREKVFLEEGVRLERALGGTGALLVGLPEGRTVPDGVKGLSRHPEVEYAEPNHKVKAQ